MGQFPRKCKLRGPSRVTSGEPPGTLRVPCTFRRGLIAKIRQKSGKIWAKLANIYQIHRNLAKKLAKFLAIFDEKIEISTIFRQWIPERCKGVHCVDLGESFPFQRVFTCKFGFDTAENEPFQVCPLSAYRSSRSWSTCSPGARRCRR